MSAKKTIRILVVDDHPIVREGLVSIIERRPDMTVVAEAQSGVEAVEMFRQHHPDITLMDLRMPQMNGVEAITAIREEFPQARIIVLTIYDGDEYISRGVKAGAQAFLLKDSPRELIASTIRTVHAGHMYIPQEVAVKLASRMSIPELTTREREVLDLMAKGKTNYEIGSELYIAEATVKSHVNRILSKMQVNDRTQAVTLALRRGLVALE